MPKKVTDATKAKLPLPKGHPQKRGTKKRKKQTGPRIPHLLGAVPLNETGGTKMQGFTPKRVQCPSCEQLVSADPKAVHSCYDAKALNLLLAATPSPIAGQPIPADLGSQPAPDFRAIPCGEDHSALFNELFPETPPQPQSGKPLRIAVACRIYTKAKLPPDLEASIRANLQRAMDAERDRIDAHEAAQEQVPPPDTSAYPWPLKAAWWMDSAIPRLRTWTAHQLTRLAGWVTP